MIIFDMPNPTQYLIRTTLLSIKQQIRSLLRKKL